MEKLKKHVQCTCFQNVHKLLYSLYFMRMNISGITHLYKQPREHIFHTRNARAAALAMCKCIFFKLSRHTITYEV